ncbi:hypothetical protein BaRGS_00037908, partial [Batillaria attramentaria]
CVRTSTRIRKYHLTYKRAFESRARHLDNSIVTPVHYMCPRDRADDGALGQKSNGKINHAIGPAGLLADTTLERNNLMEKVYPKLKEFCREKHGLEFQVVDMRWGVRDEATDDHMTTQLCMQEIDNCQRLSMGPNFIEQIGEVCDTVETWCSKHFALSAVTANAWRSTLVQTRTQWRLQPCELAVYRVCCVPFGARLNSDKARANSDVRRANDLFLFYYSPEGFRASLPWLPESGLKVFLGQKYGYRPIPTHIVATEFELLRECAKNVPDEVELLDRWYLKDHNTVPPVYILQPISSILTNFNNKRHQRLMELDQNTWWEIMGRLQRIIRKSAQVLFLARKLDREQMHNYFMSVTEREVERGILKAKNTDEHCLAYIRDIANINITLLRMACKFVDVAAKSVDNEAQKLLKTLRDDKLPKKLCAANIARFSVEWTGKEGIDEESHRQYFDTFCEKFYSDVTKLIDQAMAKHVKLANDPVYNEPLQHLHACRNHVSAFQGREDVVHQIRDYVLKDTSHKPLVLHGLSGCGKTSLMAKAASQ